MAANNVAAKIYAPSAQEYEYISFKAPPLTTGIVVDVLSVYVVEVVPNLLGRHTAVT